ncbi:MAG: ABC transporter permease, partial [Eubacteriales bacterium]|nr:ABC transporter permease [Eubacteriales bacterium]
MRMLAFSNRNLKEIVRDPLTVAFSLGFPLVLLLLLSAIQANIPVPMFEIETLAPGMCIFGLTFMTLFSATLIARDRETSFLRRLYTTPMRAGDFICGYMLPIIPISVGQSAVCYAA